MAVVGQRPTLFRGTLRSNLLIAAPLASEEMLQQAVQQAQLASWVAALPQGFDTPVGERGRLLSGGEGQRLAVARAILKQAPVWLLDEPTVHLDGAMRRSLACALEQVTRDRSLIWVTHHFEEVKAMDEVLVLWDGRIVERGRPADLRSVAAWYSSPS